MRISDWSSDVCSSDLVGHAGEGTAGAPAGDEMVQAPAGEAAQDLRGRGLAVVGGIGLVLELPGEEPAVLRRQFLGPAHHAGAALGGGGEEDLRRSEEHTSELQALMRISYAVYCLTNKKKLLNA